MEGKKAIIVFESSIKAEDYRNQTLFDIFYKRKTPAIILLISFIMAITLVALQLTKVIELHFKIFILLTVYIAAVPAIRFIIGRIVKSVIEPDKICINNTHTYTVTPVGIHMTGGVEETDLILPWRIISEAYEVQNSFYIYINMAQNLIFPKRDLRIKGVTFMREVLSEQLGEKFYTRTRKNKEEV